MKVLRLGTVAIVLLLATWATMAAAATNYYQGWNVPDDLAGWVPNTIHSDIHVENVGGNPGGYLKTVRNADGFFAIGATTELAAASGDYSNVFEISVDVRFDVDFVSFAAFRARYQDATHNGWYYPLTGDFTPGVWKTYAIPLDPNWTDAEAIGAGWVSDGGPESFALTFSDVYHPEIRIDGFQARPGEGVVEPLAASIDNFRLRACEDPKTILMATFDTETPGSPPDLTLPGAPTGDFLTIGELSGTITVQPSVGSLTVQPVLMDQVPGIGSMHMTAWPASAAGCNLVRVGWNSLARSNDIFFLAMVLRDPSGLILGSVEYRANGVLTYNSVGGVGPTIAPAWTADVDMRFDIIVDFVTQTTSLSIDGAVQPGFQNVPFAQAGITGLARLGFEAGGTTAQQFAVDSLLMTACDCPAVDPCLNDETPPTLSVSLSPDVLWPPNHKLADIHATVNANDNCDESPTVTLISITSDEPDNGLGDGDTENDIQDATYGTLDLDFKLRSERQGGGDGRVYTVCYRVVDNVGNADTVCATVTVPHDQSAQANLKVDFDDSFLVIYGRPYAPAGGTQQVILGNGDFDRIRLTGNRWLGHYDDDGELDLMLEITPAEGDAVEAKVQATELYARWSNRAAEGHFLASLNSQGVLGVGDVPTQLAASVRPNPAVGMAQIRCALPREMKVELSIFDVAGREVARLADGVMPAGLHTMTWSPRNRAGGLYLYRLRTPVGVVNGRFVVVQ